MKRLKILYFSSFGSLKGGGQRSLLLLFKYLDKRRFTPVCVTPERGSFTDKLKDFEIRNYVVPMGPVKSINLPRIMSTVITIYKIIKKENIDIIHTDGPRNTFYGGIAAKFSKKPVITHVRVAGRSRFDDRIMAMLTDYFIFVSNAAKKRFAWINGKKPSKIIYNCVDVDAFEKYRTGSKTAEGPPYRIGCIGRIEKAKGQIYLVRAAKKVLEVFPDCLFIFIGEMDHSYLMKLKKEASKINENIQFTGFISEPYENMKNLELIILPSLSEGFSRVVMESMAMEKPIIATNTGGNAEIINDGITGYLVPPYDHLALAEKIIFLLKREKDRHEVAHQGFQYVKKYFHINIHVEEIENIYTKLSAL